MLFNSFSFIFFFIVVWSGTRLLNHRRSTAWRNVFLLLANLTFYAWFRWSFLIWLAAMIAVNYVGGLWLAQESRRGKQKLALIVVLSLLPLVLFKYVRFFAGSLAMLWGGKALLPENCANWVLPVGLSFFTFQALTYSIDLYRKKIAVERNLVDFALFVSFFPTILSGPITRSRDFLWQLKQPLPMNTATLTGGVNQFIWGLFKKCVVAERLAQYVDTVYYVPDAFSGKCVALAAVCYSIQIYCDFSGYSDMAIGTAQALGVSLKKNFDYPYFASGIREFWKRWHIALTGWFTEYLYFSCGGNRVGRMRWVFNIMLVFWVSGLWHGANWTFLVWGGLHGILYLVEFAVTRGRKEPPHSVWEKVLSVGTTFAAVTVAWIFFRAPDFGSAVQLLTRIFWNWGGRFSPGASAFSFAVMLGVTVFALAADWVLYRRRMDRTDGNALSRRRLFFSIVLLLSVELLAIPTEQFVYFLF